MAVRTVCEPLSAESRASATLQMRLHVGSEHRIDSCLITLLLSKPVQQIRIQPDRYRPKLRRWLAFRRRVLQLLGPALATVEDGNQFQSLPTNAVRDDISRIGHHQFARPRHPTWAPYLGMRRQQCHSSKEPLGYQRRVLPRIPRDKLAKSDEVPRRPR